MIERPKMTTNPQTLAKHSLATKIFHHIGILLIVGCWALVEFGENIPLHKALGASFLLWTLARLVNMGIRKRLPKLPQPKWQVAIAHLTHTGLYLCMLAMPITGILMSMYGGRGLDMFGLFTIAPFVSPDRAMSKFFGELHGDLIFPALCLLVLAHIGGALYHQFILKDNLLARMK